MHDFAIDASQHEAYILADETETAGDSAGIDPNILTRLHFRFSRTIDAASDVKACMSGFRLFFLISELYSIRV